MTSDSPLGHALQNPVDAVSPGFHTPAGAEYGDIGIEAVSPMARILFFRQASENSSRVLAYIGNEIQHFRNLFLRHEARSAIGAFAGINQISVTVIFSVVREAHPHDHNKEQCQHANADQRAENAIREGKHSLKARGYIKRGHRWGGAVTGEIPPHSSILYSCA